MINTKVRILNIGELYDLPMKIFFSILLNKFDTFFFFLLHSMACNILFPRPGTEPMALAVEVQSPNHWSQGIPHPFIFNVRVN